MNNPRVRAYEASRGCTLLEPLGMERGQDGFVLRSDRATAVKFFDSPDRFRRERDVYLVLRDRGISKVAGHAVPELIEVDEQLSAMEMTIVSRPFLLDFAGAKHPEEVPDFDQGVLDEHLEHLRDLFDDRWADALHVADVFRRQTGFILLDIHPGNIAFGSSE